MQPQSPSPLVVADQFAGDAVDLESILRTDQLDQRPSRSPDFQTENRALVALAQAMADSPATILQTLADKILEVFHCGSAGISLLMSDGARFYWPAIAGVWKPHIGGGTPRNFGPCGVVLDRNAVQLFTHVERYYPYFRPVTPAIEECLLVPFYIAGKAVGTIWAIAHDDRRKFDAEDMRQLVSLGRFAASAYQVVESLRQLRESKEEAESANRAKDRFLAVLSHELRMPLAPVVMTVAAMETNPDLPPAVRDDAKMIRRNVELEVKLIDDLLDLSRITSGKLHLQLELLDINDLMRHVCEMCRSNVQEKGITLYCDFDANAGDVSGDQARLHQVFWNLLNNAAKFTPEGGNIRVATEHAAGDRVRVTVSDTGIGIPPEILPRIFDAFEQGDVHITRQFGGLGLGLAISKLLVDQHQGSIRAETKGPNKGSTFVVELPAVPHGQALKSPARSWLGRGANTAPLRMLVVEDHADTARTLSRILAASGHAVKTATSAADALALAGAHPFDIIVSDLGLPDMTGYELMKQIKERYGTKGIAMSGYGTEDDMLKSAQAGFSDHLVKPVSIERLESSILRVIQSTVTMPSA